MRSETAMQVLAKLRQALRVARPHSGSRKMRARVSSAQIWALREVEAHPGIKVTELARAMALHQSTISNLIQKLVQKQLIRRKADGVDARVWHLYVTAAGKRVLSRTAPLPQNSLLDTLEHLSPGPFVCSIGN